ncbi:hypothetical protein STAIW_v1c05520 [Spiroplasma taiwanense CT-1]|uniref:Uncharacterized protein n=1 Tax=Spiroplasma taiwanense CT-1 TaxID=1276220 RepID=S5LZQ9_9MOLU|nr:hypothetical protein STAIW_v1c05520 [Spiroplasma taiwanense CT-1]
MGIIWCDESLDMNFYQNFINVNFLISGIWTDRYSVVFEKATVE